MTWLLELLFDSIRTMCTQFIVDVMDSINGVFTDLLSCDLSLFEELFSVAGELYQNAILPMGIALLLLICIWQLFKTMFGRVGTNAEDPVELIGRSLLCLFMVVFAKPMVNYILDLAGTPYGWITGGGITVASFSEFTSAAELVTGALGIDTLSIQLLLLILQFVVAWNYFKLLFIVAERYVLLGVFSYTAPLAFSTGGSKATNNILASWAKTFGGQIVLIILDAWGLKLYLSAYGNLMASSYGFTKFFVCCLMLIGFCKIMQKLDSYLAALGLNLGRTNPGMSGTALAMMAGRMLGRFGGYGEKESVHEQKGAAGESPVCGAPERNGFDTNPIPMSGAHEVNTEKSDMSHMENGRKEASETGYEREVENTRYHAESDGAGRLPKEEERRAQQQNGKGREPDHAADTGILAGYDEETWKSRQEEAEAMETAIEAAGDGFGENTIDGTKTGIVSSPLNPDEDELMEPEGYEPGIEIDSAERYEDAERHAAEETEPGEFAAWLGAGQNEHMLQDMQNKAAYSETTERVTDSHGETAVQSAVNSTADPAGTAAEKQFCKNGTMYLSADAYEEPEVPYQMESRNGRRYYAVSREAASGSVNAKLLEDGSIQYETVGIGGWKPQRKVPHDENGQAGAKEGMTGKDNVQGQDEQRPDSAEQVPDLTAISIPDPGSPV